MEPFRVRLNCVDHYQAAPTEFDPHLRLGGPGGAPHKWSPNVPVIRVFGATETGQKVCAHIHGALPYLYVEYEGSLDPKDVNPYIHRLHLSIDHALAISYRRNAYDGKSAYVAHITLVKGIPFYGFHVGYKYFLKIYMLNPLHMTRLADVLQQGIIMKRSFQPYESHLQYLLQWMCDYNLFGCSYLDCKKVKFRSPIPQWDEMDSIVHQWHDRSIDPERISKEDILPRQSHCSIEIDICVEDIMNREDVKARDLHHDFIERSNPVTPDEKLVRSMAGLWRDETRRRKAKMPDAKPGSSPFPPEVLISMSAESRSSQRGGWIHEDEYMEDLRAIIRDEQSKNDEDGISYDTFVKRTKFEDQVQTALESVGDLYPDRLRNNVIPDRTTIGLQEGDGEADLKDVEVDEFRIPDLSDNGFPYDSEGGDLVDEGTSIYPTSESLQGQNHIGQGITNAKYDDEARPNEDSYARQIQDASTDQQPREPNSSAELESLGIRNAGDFEHAEDDEFDIPPDYASDISGAKARLKRVRHGISRAGGIKRRRLSFEDPPNDPTKQTPDLQPESLAEENRAVSPIAPGHVAEKSVELPTTGRDPARAPLLYGGPIGEAASHNGPRGNKTLGFPVVKNAHDPDTILRLSQRSAASQKSEGSKSEKTHTSTEVSDKSIGLPTSGTKTGSDTASDDTNQLSPQAQILSGRLYDAFELSPGNKQFIYTPAAPSTSLVLSTLSEIGLPAVIYQDAYYSDEKDVPDRAREYAGREFKLESKTLPFLPDFDPTGMSDANFGSRQPIIVDKPREEAILNQRRGRCGLLNWEIAANPPSHHEVRDWTKEQRALEDEQQKHQAEGLDNDDIGYENTETQARRHLSQIDGPTQKHRHGFKFSQNKKSSNIKQEAQYMSIMSIEVHVNTRSSLLPNPEEDEIACIFWCLQSDDEELESNGIREGTHVGILALSNDDGTGPNISTQAAVEVCKESSELDLFTRMVDIVRYHDPDILTGYEVHGSSWGYLIERARCKYEYNLCDEFSRMRSQSHGRFGKENDRWGFNHTSTIRVTGRHMINIWRAMRGELNLLQYTMENVCFHLLHRRIPHYPYHDLTRWYSSQKPRDLAKVIDYYISRVQLDLEILEQNELIPRISEQARLLGVDFFSVMSRGSQFKVESLMFRIAKAENFLLVSPNRKQVGQQNALECLPLVMEPQSNFYSSPLLVLDFQSLYPSVMIAYNYCYSTFLGRVVSWRGQNKMGFTDFKREQGLLELLGDQINIAPNGIMYAKPEIRKSLLAKMLSEILETRVMVKSGMKQDKDDKALQRLLNNRQLALKLIANVTYGYTSASFSGRMPCSEIADSIVQTGRETLEKAIALIHSVKKWNAEVVYGDTDSLFVYLKGRSKDEAFDIGEEIANTVTKMNPRPVKLKFEKVYLPCVLMAKKRYVGFKYENRNQTEPDFDAKGIETVRRDGTPAEQKIEEKALKILFRTADLSQVKSYVQGQCRKIMQGRVSIQDFCFAKEVKLGSYSDRGLPPPGALISARRMLQDPRAEPQYGERVPYVVITGAPGARLIDRCVAPETLLENDHNELDAEYYISKNLIPPLERIFNLVGANVRSWYDEMPKWQRIRRVEGAGGGPGGSSHGRDMILAKKTLESYMKSSSCLVCNAKLDDQELPICRSCSQRTDTSVLTLRSRLRQAEKKALDLEKVCRSCSGLAFGEDVRCDSKDCPVLYTRKRHMARLGSIRAMTEPVVGLLEANANGQYDW
ncbi:MAG: hypothetical protein M1819_000824 [Sarea resinae]|nr:MAG: hypothetical protein M1819_000824 [Sarea resinae]